MGNYDFLREFSYRYGHRRQLTCHCNNINYRMNQSDKYRIVNQVLALCRFAGVEPRLFEVLIHHFHNLEDIFRADTSSLMAINGMATETAKKISHQTTLLKEADKFHTRLTERDIAVTTRFDNSFPQLLFELNDPPPLLYIRGKTPDNSKKTVALVGAENATNQGIELTVRLAGSFGAAGVQIVASLRKGIDAAAHLGAKAADGISFGVLDSGFDHIHPPEHIPLAIDIAQSGGVISEYPPDQIYTMENYNSSNRILVGLAQAVVVTELYNDSIHALNLLSFCRQIGKLTFFMINPEWGTLADEGSFAEAVSFGAIPMVGFDKIDDIIKVLI